ncbi:MAG: HD domain-containing protein [Acidobacteriota bacterium]
MNELADRLDRQVRFLEEIGRLTTIQRRTRIAFGDRLENSAEHSWHIAMLALILAEHGPPGLDIGRVITMLLVHEIVEIDAGDTFAYDAEGKEDQAARERAAADRLFGLLPDDQAASLRAAWDEFEAKETPEARFAHAVDRFQPTLLNVAHEGGTWREHGVTRPQVDDRLAPIGAASPVLGDRVREMLDQAESEGWFDASFSGSRSEA